MVNHSATQADIMAACLHNLSDSTIALQFGVKYVPGFALRTFVQELLVAILSQPYRGEMLHELNDLFSGATGPAIGGFALSGAIDFQGLLSAAVNAQGGSLSCFRDDQELTRP